MQYPRRPKVWPFGHGLYGLWTPDTRPRNLYKKLKRVSVVLVCYTKERFQRLINKLIEMSDSVFLASVIGVEFPSPVVVDANVVCRPDRPAGSASAGLLCDCVAGTAAGRLGDGR